MNTIQKLRIFGLALLLLGGASVQEKVNAQPGVSITFQTFYNDLAPYGRWANNPQYGSVWMPNVERGFQPYSTNGYWEMTQYGNTWVSDYDWGWAPFHYGRWSYDDYNGWFWIPDYEWGPAWVNWRTGGDYYGWAPLGPGMNVNISINIPSFWWVFVPQRYISTRNWYDYRAPHNRVTNIYNNTTIINNYYNRDNRSYAYGPRRDEIERVTSRRVAVRDIDYGSRGRVITDRNASGRYEAPDRNGAIYRQNERGYDNGSSSRSGGSAPYQSNGRVGSTDRTYDAPSRGNNPTYNGNSEGRSSRNSGNNRTYEPSAQRPEYSVPSSRSERSSGSYRSESNENRSSGRTYGGESPAVRSAPTERSSSPRMNRSESQSSSPSSGARSEGGGSSRSERSSRSPRQ